MTSDQGTHGRNRDRPQGVLCIDPQQDGLNRWRFEGRRFARIFLKRSYGNGMACADSFCEWFIVAKLPDLQAVARVVKLFPEGLRL